MRHSVKQIGQGTPAISGPTGNAMPDACALIRLSARLSFLLCVATGFLFLSCSRELSEQEKQADATLARARVSIVRGELSVARRLLGEGLALDEILGRTTRVADELRLLGSLMRSMARFDSAAIYYSGSIEHYRNVADRAGTREVTMEIAALDQLQGEDRKAQTLYIEALRLARVFNETEGVRAIEWAMLPVCRALNESDDERQALADLELAAGKDAQLQARVQHEIALSQLRAGLFDSSAQSFRRASAFADRSKDTLLSLSSLLRLAMTYDAAGRLAESFQTYGDVIRRSEHVRGSGDLRFEIFTRVGNIYLRMGKGNEALRFYRAGLTCAINGGNRIAEGYLVLQIGCCEMETSKEAALKGYRSAWDLFRSLSYAPGCVDADLCMGIALQRLGQFGEAEKHLRSAQAQAASVIANRGPNNLYKDCERSYMNPTGGAPFERLFELLVQSGKYDDAFGIAERQNSSQIQTALDAFVPHPADESLAGALGAYFAERAHYIGAERLLEGILSSPTTQKEQVALVREALDASWNRLERLADGVVQQDRALEPVVRSSGTTLSAVQKVMGARVAFVEYVAAQRSLYSFVVTNAGASVQMAAVSHDSLESQCRQFLALLHRRESKVDTTERAVSQVERRLNELTMALHTEFVRPVESIVAGCSKIIVVFAGNLPMIPLQALRRGGARGNPYLAEQHVVTYLPSGQSLMFSAQPPGNVREVIGLGYQGSTDWDVEYELRDIRAFYKDAHLFFGQQASIATLQNEKADLLHLAVGFKFDPDSPNNSYVTLSDGKSLTGSRRISVGEWFSFTPFPTVILSDLSNEHTTIARPVPFVFLANHTAAFISNLYTPLRKTKKIFGETLYTALLQGNSVTAAYWKSQLDMMKNVDSEGPWSWGAFCLWGK